MAGQMELLNTDIGPDYGEDKQTKQNIKNMTETEMYNRLDCLKLSILGDSARTIFGDRTKREYLEAIDALIKRYKSHKKNFNAKITQGGKRP
jgi:hypothetical protein